MRRRALLCGAVAILALPVVVEAQSTKSVQRIGLLDSGQYDPDSPLQVAFVNAMRELGYRDGQNVTYEARGGPVERLPHLAADLLDLKVRIIVAWGSPAAAAAKQKTARIPIVIAGSGDAVNTGLVASWARPGGNVTGVSFQARELIGKRVELLREIVPGASRIGILWDPTNPAAANVRAGVQDVTKMVKLHFELVEARNASDLDRTFTALRRARFDGVVIMPVSRYMDVPREVADAALAHRLATVFGESDSVKAGGLIAYSVDFADMSRRAANYVDRILKGAKPADLPIEQPTKFELVINLKTAKTLGLTIPQSLLARADQVIE